MPLSPSRPRPALSAAALVGLALVLGTAGCTTVSTLNSAARNLDTFALNSLPPAEGPSRSGTRLLYIAEPNVSGALGSDRIVLKPNAIQITLLGDGRWAEPTPQLVRNLLVRSFSNTGRFAYVTGAAVGPLPDFTMLIDIESFEARLQPAGSGAPVRVVVSTTVSIVSDANSRLVASRRFTKVAEAPSTDALAVVSAFDAATGALQRELVPWATALMTGGRGAGA